MKAYYSNQAFFDEIDGEDKSYILGLLGADGYLIKNGYGIDLNIKDVELLMKVMRSVEYSGSIRTATHSMMRLAITAPRARMKLEELGFTKRKSWDFRLDPRPVMTQELVRHFVRGYFDGDGGWTNEDVSSVDKGKRYHYRRTRASLRGTSEFLHIVSDTVFEELGIRFSWHESKHPHMYLSSKDNVGLFGEWMYRDATIYMERKYQTYQQRHT